MTPTAISILEKGWMLTGAFWLLTAVGQKRAVYVESAEVSARHGSLPSRHSCCWPPGCLSGRWAGRSLPIAAGWSGRRSRSESAAWLWPSGHARCWAASGARVCAQAEHRLITNGPYARLRHPIYSGLLLAMLGTAIAGNQVRMYLAIPIAFCAFWYKSRLEERLLLHAIGARYQQYHQRTRAMIPGVL
jgi:hypothetical protein